MPARRIGLTPRDEKISIRTTASRLKKLDRDRGALSRSEYLNRLIERGHNPPKEK